MPIEKHWKYSDELVLNSLRGLTRANPGLKYLESERLVFTANANADKVSILTGGGAGHEPLHAGFVGDGMLDVAVSGQVFASPSVKQIYSGLKAVPSKKGTLVVVKNYTGDILHFGMAAERLSAEGYSAKSLVVQDDVSVGRTKNGKVGRRGLAGTVFVHKCVGAKAAKDDAAATLDEVYDLGSSVNKNLVTIGASLDHVTIPTPERADAKNADEEEEEEEDDDEEAGLHDLHDDEAEIGMGIHNEPGIKRESPLPKIDDLAKEMLKYLLDPNDKERAYVPFSKTDEVALMINNLGGTSNLEIYAIQNAVANQLKSIYGISPVRTYTGTFVTSLDGPGFSITLLNITGAGGKEVLECLDYPTTAPGWNSNVGATVWDAAAKEDPVVADNVQGATLLTSDVTFDSATAKSMFIDACNDMLKKESKITLYDTVAGDGDCGETLARGCNAVKNAVTSGDLDLTDAVKCLSQLTEIIETDMGGTSGGLYCVFVSAVSHSFKHQEAQRGKGFAVDAESMATALTHGLTTLEKYTYARVGDRTMMDALIPFVETFAQTKDLKKATAAGVDGSESTRKLIAKFGRASYVSEDQFKQFESEGGLPDPGAYGLAALLTGISEGYYTPSN